MYRLVREPLLHFVVLACLLFAFFSNDESDERLIRVSAADIQRLVSLYELQTGSAADDATARQLVRKHIQQTALAKEARSLGLDEGDIIIERRLAQKMLFMVSDHAEDTLPDEQQLRDWYVKHSDNFKIPANITFEHVYFSADDNKHFQTALTQLNRADPVDWKTLGQPFMLKRHYGQLPRREVVRIFGADFADALFKLKPDDNWVGPIRSALGFHLVRVREFNQAVMPLFEDVREKVESNWRDATRYENNAEAVAAIVGQYTIDVESVVESVAE